MDAVGPFLHHQVRNSSWLCAKTTKNCCWKRPPRTAGAACRVTTFGDGTQVTPAEPKREYTAGNPGQPDPVQVVQPPRRRRATSPTRTANQALPPASAWLAWLTPLCPDQPSTAQLDVVVRPENSETGKIAMIQRGDLYGMHKSRAGLYVE